MRAYPGTPAAVELSKQCLAEAYFGRDLRLRPIVEALSSVRAQAVFASLAADVGLVNDYRFLANVAKRYAWSQYHDGRAQLVQQLRRQAGTAPAR